MLLFECSLCGVMLIVDGECLYEVVCLSFDMLCGVIVMLCVCCEYGVFMIVIDFGFVIYWLMLCLVGLKCVMLDVDVCVVML